MTSGIFKVIAVFTDTDGKPLSGSDYSVAILDEDRYFDDRLGESPLNAEGVAEFLITVADVLSFDSQDERTPDLYFVARKDGEEVFRSEVFKESNFELIDPVTGRSKSLTKQFGPFKVEST